MATCTTVAAAAATAAAPARCSRASLALLAAGLTVLVLASAPAPAAALKAGVCPPPAGVHVCVFKCYDDTDCRGEQKCCKTLCGGSMCMNSVSAPRPRIPGPDGVCPPVSVTPWVCRSRCSSDAECPRAGQKCCQHRCGGYSCLNAQARPQRDADADDAADAVAAADTAYESDYSVMSP